MSLLPHALNHYTGLGVTDFHLVRQLDPAEDGSALAASEAVMAAAGLSFAQVVRSPWAEDLNPRLIRAQMESHPDDWWLLADLDEFHVYDRPLQDVVDHCESGGFDYVKGAVLDRVTLDGSLPELDPVTSLWDQFPLAGPLTLRLLQARPTQVTLARGSVRVDFGQHRAWTGTPAPWDEIYTQVDHFKWTASVRPRLERRIQAYASGEWPVMNTCIIDESRRVLDHLLEHGERIDVGNPEFAFERCGKGGYRAWPQFARMMQELYEPDDARRRERWLLRHGLK
ncbi:hypothetical protein [Streptomyces sp. PTY087I2]|uniref:hypothetical protein n=1 Tax=Streptomyces sp. PTY087I2 TaxID=1819298 RepID=UPI00114C8FFB|nr:hypothetical protein [Streptomyces sp. PTY087I2]